MGRNPFEANGVFITAGLIDPLPAMGRQLPVPSAVSSHGGGHIICAAGNSAGLAAAGLAAFALLALIDDRCRAWRVNPLRRRRWGQGVIDDGYDPVALASGGWWRGRRRLARHRKGSGWWRDRRYIARRRRHRGCRNWRRRNRRGLAGRRRCDRRSFDRGRLAWRGSVGNRWRRRHLDWRLAWLRSFLALGGSKAGQRERYREQDLGHSGLLGWGRDEPSSIWAGSPLPPEPGPRRRGSATDSIRQPPGR